jgi:Protein of unknown function (DUF1499)
MERPNLRKYPANLPGSKRIPALILIAVFLILAAVTGFLAAGPRNVWMEFGGPPDFPRESLAEFHRPDMPNDALACPTEYCIHSKIDLVAPVYAVNAATLGQRLLDQLPSMKTLELFGVEHDGLRLNLIDYTPVMQFPAGVTIEFIPLGEDRSSVAIYSHSQFGYWDFGANLQLVQAILDLLNGIVANAGGKLVVK